MKGLVKNLGLILVLIGVIILVVTASAGAISDNTPLGISAALMVVGLITYIITNKFFAD